MTTSSSPQKYERKCPACQTMVIPEKFCGKQVCPDCLTDLTPKPAPKPKVDTSDLETLAAALLTTMPKPARPAHQPRTSKVLTEAQRLQAEADELGDLFGEF